MAHHEPATINIIIVKTKDAAMVDIGQFLVCNGSYNGWTKSATPIVERV